MSTRARKVEVVVLGRGLAAVTVAERLVQQGRRVALLVEAPGLERGSRPAWRGWHRGEQATLAEGGSAQLERWQAEGVPGILPEEVEGGERAWRLEYDRLLPALAERVAVVERCWVATDTRVRGISVIENTILGAIAEDSRYDARHLVNAAEDDRFASFARMMRQPQSLSLVQISPAEHSLFQLGRDGEVALPGATPFLRDQTPPRCESLAVQGGWCLRGVAGWPLLAIGAAIELANRLTQQLD